MADFDLYVRLVQWVFNMARWLSPMYWLSFAWPALNPPSRRSPEEDIARVPPVSRSGCLAFGP